MLSAQQTPTIRNILKSRFNYSQWRTGVGTVFLPGEVSPIKTHHFVIIDVIYCPQINVDINDRWGGRIYNTHFYQCLVFITRTGNKSLRSLSESWNIFFCLKYFLTCLVCQHVDTGWPYSGIVAVNSLWFCACKHSFKTGSQDIYSWPLDKVSERRKASRLLISIICIYF